MEQYDLAVLGATFAGIGAAAACKGKAVVLESRQQVGYEFINSYNYGTNWLHPLQTGMGEKLKTECVQRGILSEEGLVHLPALAPILCNFVKICGFTVYLMTDVIRIEKMGGCFVITLHNVSGLQTIRAAQILDTTSGNRHITEKYLNAMLCSAGSEACRVENPRASVVKGLFSGEYVLKYQVEIADGWIAAREKLHGFWRDRQAQLAPWTISSVADCFEVKTEQILGVDQDNRRYLCSAAFDNPLQAFDAGLQLI